MKNNLLLNVNLIHLWWRDHFIGTNGHAPFIFFHRESFTSSKCYAGDLIMSLSVTACLKLYSLSFQCNVQVPIKAVQPTNNIPERFKGIHDYLTPSLLSTIQTYLTLMKLLPYEVSVELTKVHLVHEKAFYLSRQVRSKNLFFVFNSLFSKKKQTDIMIFWYLSYSDNPNVLLWLQCFSMTLGDRRRFCWYEKRWSS